MPANTPRTAEHIVRDFLREHNDLGGIADPATRGYLDSLLKAASAYVERPDPGSPAAVVAREVAVNMLEILKRDEDVPTGPWLVLCGYAARCRDRADAVLSDPPPPAKPKPPRELPERYLRLCVLYKDGQEMFCDVPENDAAEACRAHTDHLINPGNALPVAHGRHHSVNLDDARFVFAIPIPGEARRRRLPGEDDDGDPVDPDCRCPACCEE